MELPTSSCHGVLYPRYYGLVGTSSRKPPGGSRRVVLLSPRVWKGCQLVGTRDWYLMHYSTPFVTGGQKHTHTLLNAPSAMLRHWNILPTHDAEWQVPLTSLPLSFTSTESYEALKTSFENSLDMTNDVLHYPYFCSDKQFGEYDLCEAVKVDLSIQRSTQTKEQNLERYISNTMHLVKNLFEVLRPAIDCINDLDHQSMQAKLDQHFTLFN